MLEPLEPGDSQQSHKGQELLRGKDGSLSSEGTEVLSGFEVEDSILKVSHWRQELMIATAHYHWLAEETRSESTILRASLEAEMKASPRSCWSLKTDDRALCQPRALCPRRQDDATELPPTPSSSSSRRRRPTPRGHKVESPQCSGLMATPPSASDEEEERWEEQRRIAGLVTRMVTYWVKSGLEGDFVLREGGKARKSGAVLKSVTPGGLADKAGVTARHRLLMINGNKDVQNISVANLLRDVEFPAHLVFAGFIGGLGAEVRIIPKKVPTPGFSKLDKVMDNSVYKEEMVFQAGSASLALRVKAESKSMFSLDRPEAVDLLRIARRQASEHAAAKASSEKGWRELPIAAELRQGGGDVVHRQATPMRTSSLKEEPREATGSLSFGSARIGSDDAAVDTLADSAGIPSEEHWSEAAPVAAKAPLAPKAGHVDQGLEDMEWESLDSAESDAEGRMSSSLSSSNLNLHALDV